MRILLIVLAFSILPSALVFIAALRPVPAIVLLSIRSILLLGVSLGRKVVAHSLILFCTILIVSVTGSALYQIPRFGRTAYAT
jgi:hypothetical protein